MNNYNSEVEDKDMAENSIQFELIAAALRADSADIKTWCIALSQKLAAAFPEQTTLIHGGWLGNGPVEGLNMQVGDWRYALHIQHGQTRAERVHVVRDIVLKTESLPLDEWIDQLSVALATWAATNARAATVLRTFIE
jgi:hypothetical protein